MSISGSSWACLSILFSKNLFATSKPTLLAFYIIEAKVSSVQGFASITLISFCIRLWLTFNDLLLDSTVDAVLKIHIKVEF